MIQVKCPICKKPVLWNEDFPFRPFCSKRCKIRDLGAWAEESYKIPTQESGSEEPPPKDSSESE